VFSCFVAAVIGAGDAIDYDPEDFTRELDAIRGDVN
jgi:hypothetical protein